MPIYLFIYLYYYYFLFFLTFDNYLLPPDQADSVKVGEP